MSIKLFKGYWTFSWSTAFILTGSTVFCCIHFKQGHHKNSLWLKFCISNEVVYIEKCKGTKNWTLRPQWLADESQTSSSPGNLKARVHFIFCVLLHSSAQFSIQVILYGPWVLMDMFGTHALPSGPLFLEHSNHSHIRCCMCTSPCKVCGDINSL